MVKFACRSNYFDNVSEFDGAKFAGNTVQSSQITDRVLNLVVPKSSVTDAQ